MTQTFPDGPNYLQEPEILYLYPLRLVDEFH